MTKIEQIAEKIIFELKKENFIIHRYDSFSSKSIYLKLDYGVSNSIRISDHPGKSHLSYRFNIQSDIEKIKTVKGKYEKIYYPIEKVNKLLEDIKKHKKEKIDKYGEKNYFSYMKKNKDKKHMEKGFWQQAKLV